MRLLISFLFLFFLSTLAFSARVDVIPPTDTPVDYDEVARTPDTATAWWEALEDGEIITSTLTVPEYQALAIDGEPPRRGLPVGKTWLWRQAIQFQPVNTPSTIMESGTVLIPPSPAPFVVRIQGVPNPFHLSREIYTASRATGLTITPPHPYFEITNGKIIIRNRGGLQAW